MECSFEFLDLGLLFPNSRLPNATAVSVIVQEPLRFYSPTIFVIAAGRSSAYTLRVANLRQQMPRTFRNSSTNSQLKLRAT
jgi:hypothetical protein